MVAHFIFFGRMGVGECLTGCGLDLRPPLPLGRATITCLFEGEITRRDSPGAA
jgi:redox-sensitive bicupin YhaK (pirin superfamily)